MNVDQNNFVCLPIKELELGKIIQKSGWKRTSYIITTKIYWSMKSEERGLSRKHIIESVKASLQRLQLPYIDVVIIYKADSMCPMEGNLKSRVSSVHLFIICFGNFLSFELLFVVCYDYDSSSYYSHMRWSRAQDSMYVFISLALRKFLCSIQFSTYLYNTDCDCEYYTRT